MIDNLSQRHSGLPHTHRRVAPSTVTLQFSGQKTQQEDTVRDGRKKNDREI